MTLPCASRYMSAVAARGSFLAVVDKVRHSVGHANEHESAAAQVSRLGMNHRQSEASGHGGIDGVAAGLHHLDSGPGCQFVDAGNHGMRGMHRAHGGSLRRACPQADNQQRNDQVAQGSHVSRIGWKTSPS